MRKGVKKYMGIKTEETLAKVGKLRAFAIKKKLVSERRVWIFTCKVCGKRNRRSHKKINAIIGKCLKCRHNEPNPNQTRLFNN